MADRTNRLRRLNTSAKMQKNRNSQKHDIYAEGELIIIGLRAGDFFTVACKRAGIPHSTAKWWLRMGKAGLGAAIDTHICREEHVWFYEEVTRALAEVEGNAVDAWMDEVKKGNWQAARDFLARRFRRRWGSGERRQLDVRSEGPSEIQLVWADDEARNHPPLYTVLPSPTAVGPYAALSDGNDPPKIS